MKNNDGYYNPPEEGKEGHLKSCIAELQAAINRLEDASADADEAGLLFVRAVAYELARQTEKLLDVAEAELAAHTDKEAEFDTLQEEGGLT